MPKTKISEYSATANSNTDVASINIDEGCAPSGINNAIRAVMGHLKDFQAGTNSDSFNGPTNGAHNGTVGATTPAAGSFTTLSSTGNVTLGDASTDTLNVGNGGIVKDASGNVGIGTSSPSNKLHVVDATTPTILLSDGSGRNVKLNSGTASSAPGIGTYYASDFLFYTNSVERARIDSSGNLLVGTTSAPSASQSGWRVTSAGGASSSRTTTGVVSHYDFYNPNGLVGYIYTSGTTTGYNTSSDYRLKENIAPMQGALSVVSQLKPCTYNWKADGSDGQGFIAHELQAVVPDCVTGEKDAVDAEGNPVYQGIDTSFLVATLTAAIQELKATVDAQAARITALEQA